MPERDWNLGNGRQYYENGEVKAQQAGTLFKNVSPDSLSGHLKLYIPLQELSYRRITFGQFARPFDPTLLTHADLDQLKVLLQKTKDNPEFAVRIEKNDLAKVMNEDAFCIVLPFDGRGASWVGNLSELPRQYSVNNIEGAPVDLERFIVFTVNVQENTDEETTE
jgi:hypothetical protein